MRWPHGIPVVDAHVHVNRFDLMAEGPKQVIRQNPTFPLMERFVQDPQAFLDHLDAEGIRQAWLINYCAQDVMGYGREVNDWVADYVQADPERLVAVGGYDPFHDGEGAAAIDRLRELGVRALKVHPVHQRIPVDLHRQDRDAGRRMHGAYGRAEELGMPLIVHTGTSIFPGAANEFQHVAPLAHVCEDFPDLQVVLAHGGRPQECEEALAVLAAHPGAWLELSSMPPKRIPEWFGDLDRSFPDGQGGTTALAHRTLWGSDWPGPKVPGMGENVRRFLEQGLSEEGRRAVLHDNAQALLRKAA